MKRKFWYFLFIIGSIFFIILFASEKITKNPRIILLDENNEEIVYLNNENKTNSEYLEKINPKHIEYILCIEDKDFFKHAGFSIPRIIKSSLHSLFHSNTQGGSTITQQYIKNTYLSNKKSLSRKIKELYLAIKIENNLGKKEILQEYLSALYFGNNVYGLTNAAKYYYNKDPLSLTDKEFISFIALWNAPTIYSKNMDKWNQKKNILAKTLYKKGYLSTEEYLSVCEDIELNHKNEYINSNKLYYIDQVMNEFHKYSYEAKFNEIIYIKTFYNPNSELISSNLDINYSILSINKDGYITTCIGDKSYYKSTFNIAINGNRDIGSTIKPLLYYEAIRCGLEDTYFSSEPYAFEYKREKVLVTNASYRYYDYISMRTALAVSDNIYATKMHLKLGMNTLVQQLKKYDVSAKPYPSLALGSVGMSLKKLSSIYFQFFSEGFYVNPNFIYSVSFGKKIYYHKPTFQQILASKYCKKVKSLLDAPFDKAIPYATCSSIASKIHSKCYGKSGLTDYDSYLIGFNEKNLVAVWTGDIDNHPLLQQEYKKLPKELFYKTMNLLD